MTGIASINNARWTLLSASAIAMLGLVMMSSASMDIGALRNGSPFHHVLRHVVYMVIALGAALVVARIPLQFWRRYGWAVLLLSLALLAVVLIPGIGREVNGSRRWIALGPITLQASEVAKVGFIIYLAGYLERHHSEVRQRMKGFIKPLAVMAILIVMLLLEPDFGSVVVLMGACLAMIFVAGVKIGQFFSVISVSLLAVVSMALSSEYRMRRLMAFTDPWADQFNSGYQLTQSLIAFGRGEWFGVGLGNSVQKLFYLPEAHTDFLFAILAEELGLVGVAAVIVLYGVLVANIFLLAYRAICRAQYFHGYVAVGAGVVFAAQAFINIGVNSGLLPTKGLTLPFMSYGGSSLIVCCVLVALVWRAEFELKRVTNNPTEAPARTRREAYAAAS